MRELYHCFYKQPKGDAILSSCFRDVNGQEKKYLFAATHLTKSLAFAFSYHDKEVLMNSGIEDTDNELVILCGGQETLDKERHIRVYAFPDDGFQEIPRARQAVSEQPMPFSRARIVLETHDINDLMRAGLQIFVLPKKLDSYMSKDADSFIIDKYWRTSQNNGEAMGKIMKEEHARWINTERGINVCPVLRQAVPADLLSSTEKHSLKSKMQP